eukprot:1124323_1
MKDKSKDTDRGVEGDDALILQVKQVEVWENVKHDIKRSYSHPIHAPDVSTIIYAPDVSRHMQPIAMNTCNGSIYGDFVPSTDKYTVPRADTSNTSGHYHYCLTDSWCILTWD